jgi:hypothetical protein
MAGTSAGRSSSAAVVGSLAVEIKSKAASIKASE